MTGYLIGIDNGSQSSKVTIFDEHGTVHGIGRQPLRPNATPYPGAVEHPDDDLWDSVGAACRQALAGFAGDLGELAGVGLCTIRFCRALLRADGTLAHPVLSWMDERVSAPYQHIDDNVRFVTTSSGYLTHRLTGERRDTAANYQGIWPIDTDRWQWSTDDDAFERTGMPREMLFELAMPGEILGTVTEAAARHTGLPAGLPVVATANDKAVEALGCGLRSPDTLVLSLGTYIAAMTSGTVNRSGTTGCWTNFGCVAGEYLYESAGIRRGMWTVSWLRDLLGEADLDELNAAAAQVPSGSDGLLAVLNWLAPADAPHRKGALLGFDARHGRAHIYRSVLEGIALTMAGHAQAMSAELGHDYRKVIVSGGGAASEVMLRIVADVFDVEAVRTSASDAAGIGAALCAGVGLGCFDTVDSAIEAMVRTDTSLLPNAASRALYRGLRPIHRDACRALDPVFRRTAALFGK